MKILVLGSMKNEVDPEYLKAARTLAEEMAKYPDIELVFGGGNIGPLGEVYQIMKEKGHKITAVIDEQYKDDLDHIQCDDLYMSKNLFERNKIFSEISDAAIVLPGGTQTLFELFAFQVQKNPYRKPIILYDCRNFFDGTMTQMKVGIQDGLIKAKKLNNIYRTTDPDQAIYCAKNMIPILKIPTEADMDPER